LWPNDNIAIKSENCIVIDSDMGDGKDGEADLAAIAQELGPLPDGPTVITGSGGRHRYFKRPDIDVIGQVGVKWKGRKTGIDIRVGNQYVMVPPSVHPNGTPYRWERPLVPAEELPEIPQKWVEGFLPDRNKKPVKCTKSSVAVPAGAKSANPAAGQWITELDEALLERTVAYLDKKPPAVQGQGGHSTLFKIANDLVWGIGLEPKVASDLAWRRYNHRCVPPWGDNFW
jgi:hypothetical protein